MTPSRLCIVTRASVFSPTHLTSLSSLPLRFVLSNKCRNLDSERVSYLPKVKQLEVVQAMNSGMPGFGQATKKGTHRGAWEGVV